MKKRIKQKGSIALGVLFLLLTIVGGCKKEPIISSVSNQVNISGYIANHPENFSQFEKILKLTGTDGFLQAYGNYTLFLPSDAGVQQYLTDIGKSSIEEVSIEELKNLVRFHLIEDTVSTAYFSDGKLNALTMLGQYLITGVNTNGTETKITINRQANLLESNIRLGNGYVHVIDNVLRQARLTLAEMVEASPNEYSIFAKALHETGLYDTLNVLPVNNPNENQKFLTLIAETNKALNDVGIPDYTALLAKYNTTDDKNLKSPANGLHAFMAYHILFGSKYFADIATAQAQPTLANPEIISTQFVNGQILLNDIVFAGTYEPGVLLTRVNSDNTASNGVMHTTSGYTPSTGAPTTGHFAIKKREPFPVYWDVADFPEARARIANFRKAGTLAFDFRKTSKDAPSPLKGWDWGLGAKNSGLYGPQYNNGTGAYVFGDYLNMPLGISSRNEFMSAETPLIVRGTYNVWVCYRRQNQSGRWPGRVGTKARILIDGVPAPKAFFFAEPPPLGSTTELTSLGWKYYTSSGDAANPFLKQTLNAKGETDNSPWVAKNLGPVVIETTGVHIMRMEALEDSQNANNLDMIQFIPVKWESQILPRFKPDGTPDFTNYPGTH